MKRNDVRLTTAAHKPAFDLFYDGFRTVQALEHWSGGEITARWLEASFRAVRGKLLAGEARKTNEAEYMKIVARCHKPNETMKALRQMFNALVEGLEAEPIDFIGPIFSELAANAFAGQFFTPHSLSYMMAQMIVGDAKTELGDKPYMLLHEPACGVGGMVLATNQVLRERGICPSRQAHWVAVDIDFRAFCGAYLQIGLTGGSATVLHGNTLSLEEWMAVPTPMAVLFPKQPAAPTPGMVETIQATARAKADEIAKPRKRAGAKER